MPSTPLYGRRPSSSLEYFPPSSPQSIQFSPMKPTRSRQSSLYSLYSPSTPRPNSSHSQESGFGNGFGASGASGSGLGNLADELAEVWDEDAAVNEGEGQLDQNGEEEVQQLGAVQLNRKSFFQRRMVAGREIGSSSLLKKVPKSKRRRKLPGFYGLDNGDDSDDEDFDTTASLEAQISTIERLANPNEILEGGDDICKRVMELLRDITSQIGIENCATRYARSPRGKWQQELNILTSYHSLAQAQTTFNNLLNDEFQLLHRLIQSLLSPISQDSIDSTTMTLLNLDFQTLLHSLPDLTPHPLIQIHAFHTSTQDLLSTLSSFSDTLHMTRQTSTQASRRLRVAKETVENLKAEMEKAEEGIVWVERGRWQEKIERREAATACGEICGGFEEVCEGWRRKLVEQVGAR
ncbi:MAG: hypothetical protein MMC33_008387 [Icmadophila ericetorum]|nr:hypothetical protein [Icmadophila ericetorum]